MIKEKGPNLWGLARAAHGIEKEKKPEEGSTAMAAKLLQNRMGALDERDAKNKAGGYTNKEELINALVVSIGPSEIKYTNKNGRQVVAVINKASSPAEQIKTLSSDILWDEGVKVESYSFAGVEKGSPAVEIMPGNNIKEDNSKHTSPVVGKMTKNEDVDRLIERAKQYKLPIVFVIEAGKDVDGDILSGATFFVQAEERIAQAAKEVCEEAKGRSISIESY